MILLGNRAQFTYLHPDVNPIKAILVDDEEAARNVLDNLLRLAFPHVQVVAKLANLPDAVEAIKSHRPDVVFLDIEMPKFAGYQIVNFFDRIDFQIVFITAYDHYAIKAFEVNALDYLLKPIDRGKLKKVIEKVERQLNTKDLAANYFQLLKQLEAKGDPSIVIAESNKKQVVRLDSLIGIKAEGAYSTLYQEGGRSMTFSKNIGYFESLLKDKPNFFRSHKSWIINTDKISSFSLGKLEIEMQGGLLVKLSRFKKSDFQKTLRDRDSS